MKISLTKFCVVVAMSDSAVAMSSRESGLGKSSEIIRGEFSSLSHELADRSSSLFVSNANGGKGLLLLFFHNLQESPRYSKKSSFFTSFRGAFSSRSILSSASSTISR